MNPMRIRHLAFFLCIQLIVSAVRGQTFVQPEFLSALKKGTRTCSGVPGPNYFQNHADYRIEVNFNPKSGKLEGKANIVYYNTSPDTLRGLIFRLYQDILKKGGVRDEPLPSDIPGEGVQIIRLAQDGVSLTQKMEDILGFEATNMYMTLHKPLYPYTSTTIEIAWKLTMPSRHVHRFGKYGKDSYFVAYWYPQVAVYDDVYGWDLLIYNGTQEFYNDFNSFDVKIRVPGNYMVWSSGDWINPEAILSDRQLDLLNLVSEKDTAVSLITREDLNSGSWKRSGGMKTYQFRVDSIPDFAFAVSRSYLWDAASTLVDSIANRRAVIHAVYSPDAKYFQEVAGIGAEVVRRFSNESYGIPYPYPSATVFNGDGGMEFPRMVNNRDRFFYNSTLFLTMHELAHAYFPFLTGLNERKFSWMDEGLTTYLPMETEAAMGSDEYTIQGVIHNYEMYAGTEYDVPLGVSSYNTRSYAYSYYTYMRSTVALYLLEQTMGREAFREAIREFIRTWQYKHPMPHDFFAVMKKHSDRELDTYIDQWFYEQGWPDLSIDSVETVTDSLQVTLRKKGAFAVPVILEIVYENADPDTIRLSPDIWKEGDTYSIQTTLKEKPLMLRLNDRDIPDKYRIDNRYEFPSD